MNPKIKNIIIFVIIAVFFILVFIFFVNSQSSSQSSLVSSTPSTLPGVVADSSAGAGTPSATSTISQNFVSVLLNIKNIKLDDSIFSNQAFNGLHDSNILLQPDGTEGRPNPFAQFGNDTVASNANTIPPIITPPVVPVITPTSPKTVKNTTP